MEFSKIYLVNYNKLFFKEADQLLDLFFDTDSSFIKGIIVRILIDDNRIDNSISLDKLNKFVNSIDMDDVWELSRGNEEYVVTLLAAKKIIEIIDESFVKTNRDSFHIVK